MTATPRFPYDGLVAAIRDALAKEGLSPDIAATEASLAVESDLQGVPSHGVRMVPNLIAGIRDGRVAAAPTWRIVRDRAAICVLEGDRGPGRFICLKAMEEAIDRARRFGIGACLARNASHWGRAHAYAEAAARAGMIGVCMTNAKTSMAGWGSHKPVIGNNPLAIGLPGPAADMPVVFDMAMSQAAVGKVATFLREGRPVPGNWGLDAEGKSTNDAAAILKGAVLPIGEHKGAGLSLMIQLMTAALAGGLLDHEVTGLDSSGLDSGSNKLFVALDIESFIEPELFRARAKDLFAWLGEHADGEAEHFRLPGERGRFAAAENRVSGVPVHEDIVAGLAAIGVALPDRVES